MLKSFRIGSVFGIPIKLDITFLLILPLFAYLIGAQIEPVVDLLNDTMGAGIELDVLTAEWWTPYFVGLVAAIGLFVGVLAHELGHSIIAQRYGFPIDSITLWLLGGIASLSEMPDNWRQELNIGIAGPIVSVFVGVVSYGLFVFTPETFDGLRFVLAYLAILNVALAVFNLLPAFPMDGGRVLRAVFARNRPYARATQLAAGIGKFFAFLMGLFGLLMFDFILIAIAFFIYIAASSEAQQVTMKAAFQNVTVADIMTPATDLHTVGPDATITDLLGRMFTERHTGYPVLEDGRLVGLVTLSDAQEVDPVERDAYTVSEVMSTDLKSIPPGADAMNAIERMQREGIGRLLVVEITDERVGWGTDEGDGWAADERGEVGADDGDLVGLISRTDLMTALNIIRQSGSVNPVERSRTAD